MNTVRSLLRLTVEIVVAHRVTLGIFASLSIAVLLILPRGPEIAGDYVAVDSGWQEPVGGELKKPYAVLHLEQRGRALSGTLQIVPVDDVWRPLLAIKEGSIDQDGYIHLELEEESAKNVQVSASVLGLDVSAPLMNPTASITSVSPVGDTPKILELDMNLDLGGAVGVLTSIFASAGATKKSREVVTFRRLVR